MNSLTLLRKAKADGIIQQTDTQIHYADLSLTLPATPEESVRLGVYLRLIYQYGYPPNRISFEHQVKMGSSYKRIDVVVFEDAAHHQPFLICECKRNQITDYTFEEAIAQAFSYDNHVYAKYVWISSGSQDAYFRARHSRTGRKRDQIIGIPKFSLINKTFYRVQEVLGIAWYSFLNAYHKIIGPILKAGIVAKFIWIAGIFFICNLIASWANAKWLTTYVIQKTNWLKGTITFEEIYWVTLVASTLLGSWLGRYILVPDKLLSSSARKRIRQRNSWIWIIAILTIIPIYFLQQYFFDYTLPYCWQCKNCANQWKCWWSYRHFKTYVASERYWEYLTPSLVFLPVQAVVPLIIRWLLQGYARIK